MMSISASSYCHVLHIKKSNLAISSCGCQNSGPSPHCPWCSEALGNPISTPIYDQIVLEGAGPAGLDQLRVSGWEVYLQRLGHLICLSTSHEFTLVETPTKQQLPCLFFQSLSSISPPPQQQKNRQHNPLPHQFMSTPSPTIPPLPFPLPPAGPSWRREHLCNSRLRSDHSP